MIKQEQPLHNLLMQSYSKPLYQYKKDGIYIEQGPYKGQNLTEIYKKDERIIEYLEAIVDNEASSYKMKWITTQVIKDLLKNNN